MESNERSDVEETIDRICHRKMAEAQLSYAQAKRKLDHHVRLVNALPDGDERSRCVAMLALYALTHRSSYLAAKEEVEALRRQLTIAYEQWAHSEK
jgi:hypothetical protein